MPAHSKGLTWTFNLRTTDDERAAVARVVQEYAEDGVRISLNDGVRILIRRGSERPPADLAEARGRIVAPWHECGRCSEARIGCPEGRRLKAVYDQLDQAARPARPARPRLLPPPPGAGPRAPKTSA